MLRLSVSLGLFHPKFLKVTIKSFAKDSVSLSELNKPNTEIQSSQCHTITEALRSYSPVRSHPSILIFMTLFFLDVETSMTEIIFRIQQPVKGGKGNFPARCPYKLRPLAAPFLDSQGDDQRNIKWDRNFFQHYGFGKGAR